MSERALLERIEKLEEEVGRLRELHPAPAIPYGPWGPTWYEPYVPPYPGPYWMPRFGTYNLPQQLWEPPVTSVTVANMSTESSPVWLEADPPQAGPICIYGGQ